MAHRLGAAQDGGEGHGRSRAHDVPGGLGLMATQVMEQLPVQLDDEVFDLETAAAFVHLHPDTLRKSDCPRSYWGSKPLFLKSQLLLYVYVRLTHRIEVPKQ